jgi:hypothetical protein
LNRTRTALAIGLAVLGMSATQASADVWREPDRTVNFYSGIPSTNPFGGSDLASVDGVPYLAWGEPNGSSWEVRAARLDGSDWQSLGRVSTAGRLAVDPKLAVDGTTPWITWLEKDATDTALVRVARREGEQWVDVGGPVDIYPNRPHDGRFFAGEAELAFVGGNTYLEVMEDEGVDYVLDLLRLDSTGHWVKADTGTPPMFGPPRAFELKAIGGRLYLWASHIAGPGNGVARLALNGRDWENLPQPSDSGYLHGIADVGGALHAIFDDYDHSSADGVPQRTVVRYDGSAWQQVGPALGEEAAGIADVGGVPNVLLGHQRSASDSHSSIGKSGSLGVVRLNGNSWEPVAGGAINNVSTSKPEQPLIRAVGGVPYVSWAEYDGCTYQHRVARPEDVTDDDPQVVEAPCTVDDTPHGGGGDGSSDPPGGDPPAAGPCVRRALGTDRSDKLFGDAGGNTIRGLLGNDRLYGLAGADCLFGGVGNDLLSGGDGDDVLHGEAGHDRLKGGAGTDVLSGGAGNDRLTSGPGNDVVTGGSGNDVIDSRGSGFDTIDCGSGRDVAIVGDLDRTRHCERVFNRD